MFPANLDPVTAENVPDWLVACAVVGTAAWLLISWVNRQENNN